MTNNYSFSKDLDPAEQLAILSLTVELSGIFVTDESEKANIAAIEAIKRAFNASVAALFYINNRNVCRMCLAGTDFPIALPEDRWQSCVKAHGSNMEVVSFDSWSLPGIERVIPAWISARLYGEENLGSFVFLGKETGSWSDRDLVSLGSLQKAIAPIVEARHERKREEHKRDQAEKKLARNERRLREFFESSRDMIYTADADETITSVNGSGVKLLRYGSKAELMGKSFGDLALNPEDSKLFFSKMAAQGFVDDYEILLTRKDGSSVFCMNTAHAIRDASGDIIEIQGTVKDISERIAGEQKMWKMNLELAESNMRLQKTQLLMVQQEKLASIGQLAAGIAHEINNPLGFITSNQKTLEKYFGKIQKYWSESRTGKEDDSLDPEGTSMMNEIFKDVQAIFTESRDGFARIVTIVSNLKNFSRVDATGNFGDFDLNAGIESTLVVAWNEIKYVSELRRNLGAIPHIRANGGELNQVVLNILVNAAQALGTSAKVDKGLIEISTSLEGDQVILVIRDNGPGIPESIRNKIYDPFFTTKEPGKGTGLGLNISYDIVVNKHKGKIWVESEMGIGTSFFISLPVAGPDPEKN